MLKNSRMVLWLTAGILLVMLLCSMARAQEKAVPVTAARAEVKAIYNSVTANGTIEAERSYVFRAKQDAVVSEVYCQTGDTVSKGQALWALQPANELRWTTELLQNAVTAFSGIEGGESVETALEGGAAIVYAPADGTLLAAPSVGQSAPAGFPYAQAIDLNALRLRVDIAEAFVADVQEGQPANITVSATGGIYRGQVRSVAPVAKQAISLTGTSGAVTVAAILQIHGADASLKPGYSASAKIFVDEKEAAVVLPYEAIRQEGKDEYAYVIGSDQRAYRREVVTGYSLSQAIEVVSGIEPGELVILDASGELEDGVLVEMEA